MIHECRIHTNTTYQGRLNHDIKEMQTNKKMDVIKVTYTYIFIFTQSIIVDYRLRFLCKPSNFIHTGAFLDCLDDLEMSISEDLFCSSSNTKIGHTLPIPFLLVLFEKSLVL